MVNTFVTHFPLCLSVQHLDNRRLGKQRVEAQQLLNIIFNSKIIAKAFNIPLPPTEISHEFDVIREKWHIGLFKFYKASKLTIYRSKDFQEFSFEQNDRCSVKISCGFAYHPIVLMWCGYENGLKFYINLCIMEWVNRGFKNNMKFHIIFEYTLPWWVQSSKLHKIHQASLLNKEITRREPRWYQDKFDNSLKFDDYIWTCHLTIEERQMFY